MVQFYLAYSEMIRYFDAEANTNGIVVAESWYQLP
jgi:hypothetical protein